MLLDHAPALRNQLHLEISQPFFYTLILYSNYVAPQNRHDALKLFQLVAGFEQEGPCLHEVEDAPQSPNIYLIVVALCAQQQLRCPIKESPYLICHVAILPCLFSRHAKVDDLEFVGLRGDFKGLCQRSTPASQHDVGGLHVSMNDLLGVQMINSKHQFMEKLLDGIFFLTFKQLLETHCEPLHHDRWRIFIRKHIDNSGNCLSSQDCQNIVLSDETCRQSDLGWPLETFNCYQFFGLPILCLVDFSVGAFCDAFEKRILFNELVALHSLISIYHYLLQNNLLKRLNS